MNVNNNSAVKVVLGLGNPGKKYEWTRHNLGFLVVDQIASENRIAVKKRKCHSLVGDWETGREKILLVKPLAYMNHSGEVVGELLHRLRLSIKDLVVIHDDLDLPFGRIRIRPRGGAGGHRGIRSILEAIGEEGFFRVRVGIGRPPPGVDPTDFVLEAFSPQETSQLDQVISKAADAVQCLLEQGSQRAMGKFNRAE